MLLLMEVYSMTEYPIIPSRELVQEWLNTPRHTHAPKDGTFVVQKCHSLSNSEVMALAEQAARWGADQQLAKDAKWLDHNALSEPHLKIIPVGESLKEAMRPKPQSLKEQALQALANADGADHPVVATVLTADQHALIRKALEQLDD